MTTSFKFWKLFTTLSSTKNALTNKTFLPAQQSITFFNSKPFSHSAVTPPEKPKKPQSPFIEFYIALLPKLREQNPGKPVQDLCKLAGEQWKTCGSHIKSPLQEKYKKNVAEYRIAIEKFEANLTPAMKEQLVAEKEEKKNRKKKKEAKELGKPTKPKTPWAEFIAAKKGKRGTQPFSDWVKERVAEYSALDLRTKKKLTDDFEKASTKYHEDLDKWEEKMIRQGRPDLIRKVKQIALNVKHVKRRATKSRAKKIVAKPSAKAVKGW